MELNAPDDYSHLSSRELRARVRDMQDGREAEIDRARTELLDSISRFGDGVSLLRARMLTKARSAAPVALGCVAAGAVTVLVARASRAR